jgi:hypothetical protein
VLVRAKNGQNHSTRTQILLVGSKLGWLIWHSVLFFVPFRSGLSVLRSRSDAKSPDPAWWPGECRHLTNVWPRHGVFLFQKDTLAVTNLSKKLQLCSKSLAATPSHPPYRVHSCRARPCRMNRKPYKKKPSVYHVYYSKRCMETTYQKKRQARTASLLCRLRRLLTRDLAVQLALFPRLLRLIH